MKGGRNIFILFQNSNINNLAVKWMLQCTTQTINNRWEIPIFSIPTLSNYDDDYHDHHNNHHDDVDDHDHHYYHYHYDSDNNNNDVDNDKFW